MKVNNSLETDFKMSLICCCKWLLHPCTTVQLPPRLMRFTHHIPTVEFSLLCCVVALGVRVLAAQRLKTSVLRYHCFSIVQQKWVATLLLLPC